MPLEQIVAAFGKEVSMDRAFARQIRVWEAPEGHALSAARKSDRIGILALSLEFTKRGVQPPAWFDEVSQSLVERYANEPQRISSIDEPCEPKDEVALLDKAIEAELAIAIEAVLHTDREHAMADSAGERPWAKLGRVMLAKAILTGGVRLPSWVSFQAQVVLVSHGLSAPVSVA